MSSDATTQPNSNSNSNSSSCFNPPYRTKFLHSGYPLPFPPVSNPSVNEITYTSAQFYDLKEWPSDPMQVFSQWYADAEQAYEKANNPAVNWPNNMQIATVSNDVPHVRNVLLKGFDKRGFIFFTNYEGNKGVQLAVNPSSTLCFYWKSLERQVRITGRASILPSSESDSYFHSRPIPSQISASVSPQSLPIANREELEHRYMKKVIQVSEEVLKKAGGEGGGIGGGGAGGGEKEKRMAAKAKKLKEEAEQADLTNGSITTHDLHARAIRILDQFDSDPDLRPLLHRAVERPSNWGGFLIRPTSIEFWSDGLYRLHSRVLYTSEGEKKGVQVDERQGLTTEQQVWKTEFLAP